MEVLQDPNVFSDTETHQKLDLAPLWLLGFLQFQLHHEVRMLMNFMNFMNPDRTHTFEKLFLLCFSCQTESFCSWLVVHPSLSRMKNQLIRRSLSGLAWHFNEGLAQDL